MDSLICIKITTIIGQEINMKRDLYRFAKARRHSERIYLWEAEWHKKHNEEYYKQNTITNR